jgi:hypothetical protein
MIHYFALRKLDYIACILGLMGGFVAMSMYLFSPTIHLLTFGSAIFFASLLYLKLYKTNDIDTIEIESWNCRSTKFLLEAIFLILLAMSTLAFHASGNRTAFYFILISVCTGIAALFCIKATKNHDTLISIINILLLSLNIKLSKFYFFGGSGVDYWAHLKMNEMLAQVGYIGVLFDKEKFFPIMHIYVAISQLIPSLSTKDATMFSTTLPLVICSICIFFVGRVLFGNHIGLLGMLIVNVSDFQNWWSFAPQTTSYGLTIFFFLIFSLYKTMSHENRIQWLMIIFILIPLLILTHAVSSFIGITTLTGLIIGSLLFRIFFSEKRKLFSPILLLIYFICIAQHWFFAEYKAGGDTVFNQVSKSLIYYILGYASFLNRTESMLESMEILPPLVESFVNGFGLMLLIFLFVVGSLYLLSPKFCSEKTFSMFVCSTLLLGVTIMFPLFGLRNIIPHRWFAFEYFFLSLIAAFSIILISRRLSKNKQPFVVFLIFACLSFFMLTSTCTNLTNLDSPLWLNEFTISNTYTVQEMQGAETICHYSDKAFSDSRYGSSILNIYNGLQQNPFNSEDLSGLSNRADSIFVWRKYMVDRPIRILETFVKGYKNIATPIILGQAYMDQLEKMQKIYMNEDIIGYYLYSGHSMV